MKIVVFTGGTGSTALQTGLHQIYGEYIDLHLITNAYDNGLSTGLVRKVSEGQILGPSDLRKNQFTQYKLNNNGALDEKLFQFLEKRVTFDKASDLQKYMIEEINGVKDSTDVKNIFLTAIEMFFGQPLSSNIDYTDFSIANIIYAGIAIGNNYSLETAGDIMAEHVLQIPKDRVILSSDENLYLTAITESSNVIMDEGDIVKWNSEDRIIDIKLYTDDGEEKIPTLSDRAKNVMLAADLIIFSCGTQWSSLIPTYIHKGFRETLDKCKAKLILVMNNIPDKDMVNASSKDILELLKKYLPHERIDVLINRNAYYKMTESHPDYRDYFRVLSKYNTKTHLGILLAYSVLEIYFKDYLKPIYKIFDFDGTIVGRGNSFKKESEDNLFSLSSNSFIKILSGNSIARLSLILKNANLAFNNELYCDGGNSLYLYDYGTGEFVFEKYIDKTYVLLPEEIKNIYRICLLNGIKFHLIENRNNMIVSIKPLDNDTRPKLVNILQNQLGDNYTVLATGRTTIDITKKGYLKNIILKELDSTYNILYVGDELEHGNDSIMKNHENIICYPVSNPRDTLFLLKMLDERLIRNIDNLKESCDDGHLSNGIDSTIGNFES